MHALIFGRYFGRIVMKIVCLFVELIWTYSAIGK